MSITRITSIHCDGCGVWHYPNFGESVAVVRRDLRRIGWRYARGGMDYCPQCEDPATSAATDSPVSS